VSGRCTAQLPQGHPARLLPLAGPSLGRHRPCRSTQPTAVEPHRQGQSAREDL